MIVLHPLTFAEDMQFMTTTGPPAEPEIGAFFAEYTFDERIRLHAHPRLTELAQLVALRHSQSFGFRMARRILSISVDLPLPREPITAL